MSTANWITILGTLVALAATWGGLLVRVRVAEKAIRDSERGREKQGERIGRVESKVAALEGATRPRRHTQPIPAEPPE